MGYLIEGEAIPQFTRSQAKDPAWIAGKLLLHLGKKLIDIYMDGDSGVIEIPLENTVRAINRAVDDEIDDVIAATDTVMGS